VLKVGSGAGRDAGVSLEEIKNEQSRTITRNKVLDAGFTELPAPTDRMKGN
jgi:hypothetical protein